MELLYCCLLSVILSVAGYFYMIKHYFNTKANQLNIMALVYTISSMICGICVGLSLNLYYNAPLITQLKLVTLVLIIYPIAIIDYKKHIVPNIILLFAVALRGVYYIVEFFQDRSELLSTLINDALGAITVMLFFIVCALIFKSSIGMGDIKLFGVMGLYQGMRGVYTSIMFGLIVAFIVSIFLLVLKKRGRKDSMPFVPSIFIGLLLSAILSGM